MPSLKNQVILVTGANRGQGKIISKHLASLGAKVVLGARNVEEAKSISLEIGEDKSLPLQLDVTKESDWTTAVNTIIHTYKKLDVLVNNAGIYIKKPLLDTTTEDFQKLINVNQLSVFMGIKAVAPLMQKQKRGSIINNVSISSFSPINQSAAYAATKAAVTNLSKSAARELGSKGIRINMVHPGVIHTDMLDSATSKSNWNDTIPLGRVGKPNDIAHAIAFLASDQSAYCNGTEIVVDGGLTLGTDI
jgi:3alpha(or 20beta)-hydroxysteroid dehydrogenase